MGVHPLETASQKSTGVDLSIRACAWLAMALSVYALWKALGNAGAYVGRWWITSDSLYPVHVFIDTVLGGHSFSGWKFSVAPCWFPDLFLTSVFMAVTQNPIAATLLAGAVQVFLLVLGFKAVARAAGWRLGVLPEAGAMAAGTVAALHVAANTSVNPGLLGQFFLPQTHVGSLILTLYALAAALSVVRTAEKGETPPRWLLPAYGVLCFLGGMSDLLFIVQTMAPLAAVLSAAVVLDRVKPRGAGMALGIGWIASLAGYAVNRLLINTTDPAAQAAFRPERAFRTFLDGFSASMRRLDIIHLMAIAWLLLTLLVLLRSLRRRTGLRETLAGIALGALGLAGVASIGAVVVGGSTTLTLMNDYTSTLRYLHPAFLLPYLALPFTALAWAGSLVRSRAAVQSVAAVLAVGTLLAAVSAAGRTGTGASVTEFAPPIVEFLDEVSAREGLKNGVAGYWQARPITLLSRTGVRAYAVSPTMEPFLWVSNAEWYQSMFSSRPPKVDFVVLDDPLFHLDAPQAHAVFGPPARSVNFQGMRVLLYRCNTCILSPEQRAKTWMDEPLTQYVQLLESSVRQLALRPREQTLIPVRLTNAGTEAWGPAGKRPVNVAYKLLRDGAFFFEGERTILPGVLGGGESVDLQVRVTAPAEPGEYTVQISVVQEAVVWLMDRGGAPLVIPLEVR